ncbi:unnamed protein product [Miscanthus lutarioriparius]|uniref:Uncharacterized protein n=1 Tax=Miscanthus lutarioriparius TaxID=422564 RepID=A0A811PCF1_9POAL|nr:unnamed protein product [Miscanthus lutarioriparius]
MDATGSRAGGSGGDQNGKENDEDKKQGAAPAKKVSLLGIFRYADRLDLLLMAVGTVGALANGVTEPLMTVLFGNVIDSFGDSTSQDIVRSVRKVSAHRGMIDRPRPPRSHG